MPSTQQQQPRRLRLESLVSAHAAQRDSLITQLIKLLLGIWSPFSGWGDDDLMNVAAGQAATYALAATKRMRQIDLAFTKMVFAEYGIQYDGLDNIEDVYPRSGVSALEVHRRPALQYRYAISQGKTADEARQAAIDRATALAETDVRTAGRDESHRAYQATTNVIGWRRILHPELSRTGPCGLCVVASDRFYKTSDLEELHDKCVCGKLPVVVGADPGTAINRADLDRIYAAAGSTGAEDLKRTRVVVRQNGELGPILTRQGQNFRDANDAGASPYSPPTPEEHRQNLLAMKESLVGSAERLQQRLDTVNPSDSTVLELQAALRVNADTIAAIDRRLTNP